ncbi:protein PHYTOCHROME KINASE SUBSTRATE 4-like [Apium graveolens]|uniref:protein PHYTOCHROME KINASE SUBSTRATE 4-like n=1 Tax=Apium graveolens TaxID=4045 RepID=UPI003D7A2C32
MKACNHNASLANQQPGKLLKTIHTCNSFIIMEMKANSEVSIFDAGRNLIQESWSPDRNRRWSSSSSSSVCNSTSADGRYSYGARSVNATPTYASSDASSKSQKALITTRSMPVNIHLLDKKQGRGRRKSTPSDGIKWLFRQRCLCSGKKCVQVKQELVVLSHKKLKLPSAEVAEMYPRNQSISHKLTQRAKERDQLLVGNSTHQRSLSSHCQRYQQPPSSDSSGMSSFPVFSNPTTTDDDVASDVSSDLFEIESFSTHTTYFPPEESQTDMIYYEQMIPSIEYCYYEPSEASIGWSITTSEGFDLDRPSMSTFSISDHQVQERQCHRQPRKEERKWPSIADQKPVSIGTLSLVKDAAYAETSSGNDN